MQATKIDKYTKEVLEELKNTKQQVVLNPSQDFYKNNMVYSFVNNDNYYIVNSKKRIIKYDDLQRKGIKLRNNNMPSICNFTAKVFQLT